MWGGFAVSSVGIGFSAELADVVPGVTPIGALIGLRVLQGLFGALLQPAALALLRSAFPGPKLNQAMGAWGAIIGLSSAAGPIVGGLLVGGGNWESVFFINAPRGRHRPGHGHHFDQGEPRQEPGQDRLARCGAAVRRDVLAGLDDHQGPPTGAGATARR
ncbi:hypothetical protein GCM10020001_066410 [Nonomuraea salmonea]